MQINKTFEEEQSGVNPYTTPLQDSAAQQPESQPPRKFAGKFESLEEFEKGHSHLQTTLTERNRELDETRAALAAMTQVLQTVGAPDRMSPNSRSNERAEAEAALNAAGIPVDQLTRLMEAKADERATARVKEALEPIIGASRARQTVEQDFPDVDERDVARYLRQNPELQRRYQDKLDTQGAEAAWDFAFSRYVIANRPDPTTDGPEHQAALRAAGLPTGAQEFGRKQGGEDGREALAERYDEYLNTGNASEFVKERLYQAGVLKRR